jgi:hypothetical protein
MLSAAYPVSTLVSAIDTRGCGWSWKYPGDDTLSKLDGYYSHLGDKPAALFEGKVSCCLVLRRRQSDSFIKTCAQLSLLCTVCFDVQHPWVWYCELLLEVAEGHYEDAHKAKAWDIINQVCGYMKTEVSKAAVELAIPALSLPP